MTDAGFPEAALQAYVDGRLDPAAAAQVAAWLASNPAPAAQVAAWRLQKAAIVEAFTHITDEPVPPRLLDAAAGPARPGTPRTPAGIVQASRKSMRPRGRTSLALAAMLLLGVGIGRLFDAPTSQREPVAPRIDDALAREAAAAHAVYAPEIRHPVEVAASDEAHLVAWLSKRLGRKLPLPRLDAGGFELLGGRLLPGEHGLAAQLMYQDGAGRRLTLYVRVEGEAATDTAFRFAEQGSLRVFHWVDGGLGYALSGDLGRDELQALATTVHRQIGS